MTGLATAIAMAALLPLAPAAKAQDAIADFYKGKSIRFIIGAITGGGNDTYARLVGRHLGKHIPGNPTIVPVNMPGASGHVSAAHIYNVAAKDGTVIGIDHARRHHRSAVGGRSRQGQVQI